MIDKKHPKWDNQESAIRATQMAFDLSTQVQKHIKKSAIDAELTPADMIRRILGLEVKSKKTRQRLSFNLNEEELHHLAKKFDLPNFDKREIKQKVAETLINYSQDKT